MLRDFKFSFNFLFNGNIIIAKFYLFLTIAEYRKRFAYICNGNTAIYSNNILTPPDKQTWCLSGASSTLAYSHSFPVKYRMNNEKSLFGAFRSWSCFPLFLLRCLYSQVPSSSTGATTRENKQEILKSHSIM